MTDEQLQELWDREINWMRLDAQGWRMVADFQALLTEVVRLRALVGEWYPTGEAPANAALKAAAEGWKAESHETR